MTKNKAALIYNPHAGAKRRFYPPAVLPVTLEDLKNLLAQYEIPVEYFPTKYPGHATEIAKILARKKYKLVLAAGGDGTVSEVVAGIVNSNVTLGILPLGSFMNIAKMLSIPNDLEKAVQILKIGRSRKLDIGQVVRVDGKNLNKSHFFVESAGVGLEAEIFGYVQEFENGNYKSIWHIIRTYLNFLHQKVHIVLDDKKIIETRASMVTVSNGPVMGASIEVAPTAKLNDHRLTVSIFKMSKFELLKHFLLLTFKGKIRKNRKVQVHLAKKVLIKTSQKKLIHADGGLLGQTPVELKIIPNALSMITGFPTSAKTSALLKKTFIGY